MCSSCHEKEDEQHSERLRGTRAECSQHEATTLRTRIRAAEEQKMMDDMTASGGDIARPAISGFCSVGCEIMREESSGRLTRMREDC